MKLDHYAMLDAFAQRDVRAIKTIIERHFNVSISDTKPEVICSDLFVDQLRASIGHRSCQWDAKAGFSEWEIRIPYREIRWSVWFADHTQRLMNKAPH
jgi:hypothetical protein